MKGYKYFSTKKVLCVSELNDSEMIVKEVLVDIKTGNEVGFSDNFVVKKTMLYDEAVETYADRKIRQDEERLKKHNIEFEREFNSLVNRHDTEKRILRNKLDYIQNVNKNISEKSFDMLKTVLCDEYKYIVVESPYGTPKLFAKELYDRNVLLYEKKEFRLLSLFGNDKGDLNYMLNYYPDYSGGYGSDYHHFFETFESAVEFLNNLMENKKYNDSFIQMMTNLGLPLDKVKLKEYIDSVAQNHITNISKYEKDINDSKTKVEELKNKYNEYLQD